MVPINKLTRSVCSMLHLFIALHHSSIFRSGSSTCLAPLRFTPPVLFNDTPLSQITGFFHLAQEPSIFAIVSTHVAGSPQRHMAQDFRHNTIQAFTLFPGLQKFVRFCHCLRSPDMCLFALLEPSPSDTFCYYVCCVHYQLLPVLIIIVCIVV